MKPPDPRELAERIADATSSDEFDSFVIGFSRPASEGKGSRRSDVYDREAHEAIYRPIKIAVGEELAERWPERRIDFQHPEIRIDVRDDGTIDLVRAPIFLAGRYRKLSRDIPSSRWIHHSCRGRGCDSCGWTGTLCGPSVQEIVSEPIVEWTGAEETFFHGLGREDTHARMLGDGSPFVLEVRRPRIRTVDLEGWERETNRRAAGLAEILLPAKVDRPEVRLLKEEPADKTYRAWIELEGDPPDDAEERVAALAGVDVAQYSPTRVKHRRGDDVVRHKKIFESTWLGRLGELFVWEVRASSGAYIKELVSSDDGRTRPSIAESLERPARCRFLDVLEIHWEPPWET